MAPSFQYATWLEVTQMLAPRLNDTAEGSLDEGGDASLPCGEPSRISMFDAAVCC